jgi:hypothetical protein
MQGESADTVRYEATCTDVKMTLRIEGVRGSNPLSSTKQMIMSRKASCRDQPPAGASG